MHTTENQNRILVTDQTDIQLAKENGLNSGLIDRPTLNQQPILAMVEGIHQVIALDDPIGEVISQSFRPNGHQLAQICVPLGVVGMIHESRLNVKIDASISVCNAIETLTVYKAIIQSFWLN